ncbi:hypothetical protein GCM10007416_07660 [Kroppenstedtia guangzhouensis]|uniref:Uncharacterized protein n=1 Tax=Kroppenstedtia guangzhouensis TaxID=1274356 RepID=A0ABQ1G4G3_9BACL|nr:hypothetical protein [Kroppenstedtia guangzhouensis]GGA37211.1 hypothetical protein GCM10007416_07660 [Kroppenstedtia guangzhouensis]
MEQVENYGDLCDRMEEVLRDFLQAGHQTVAILTKDIVSAQDLYDQLTRGDH